MADRPDAFMLSLDTLRAVAAWAADCAERALPVYAASVPADDRPQAALAGSREFAAGGPRTKRLRALAWAAQAAAGEAGDLAAAAAARAAMLAVAVAYTHPLATAHQTKHILGPAVYAALALELAGGGDPTTGNPSIGDGEVRWAIAHAPAAARELLRQMPARQPSKSRLDALYAALDTGIRGPAA